MQEVKVSVLGKDQKSYNVADFAASGKNYSDAIGIIFETPLMSRVLAFEGWLEKWGNTNRVLTEAQSEAEAVQVLSGLELTKRIVEAQADMEEMTAAKRCWNNKTGGLQWYLPCLMEVGALYVARDKINEAMKILDCPDDFLLPTENSNETWVWSSSESSQYGSWTVYFGYGSFFGNYKSGSGVVRAVAAIQPSPSLSTGEAKSTDCLHSDEALVEMLRERGYQGTLSKTLTV